MDEKRSSSSNNNLSEDELDLRRGPWTVDEDLTLINYIATHGEGRWNTLALNSGLKRTGKSCRLRWLNYLRPDVRRGNITLQEQLLILELHSRWGNRWSKIAQYLPGRTDNEIKNYWRTRVQKHAKQLKCDVNSKQFKDTMRYLWMPRLMERIQAATAASSTITTTTTTTTTAATMVTNNNAYTYGNNLNNNNFEVHNNNGKVGLTTHSVMNNNDFVGTSHVTQSYTPENSSTAASSSDSFGTQVSTISDLNDYYSVPVSSNNQDYYQPSQISYSDCITQRLDFQSMEPNNPWNMQHGDSSDNFWNVESMLFLEQQLMNDNM